MNLPNVCLIIYLICSKKKYNKTFNVNLKTIIKNINKNNNLNSLYIEKKKTK